MEKIESYKVSECLLNDESVEQSIEAVRASLQSMVNSRAEAVVQQCLRILPWPGKQLRLLRSERGLLVLRHRPGLTTTDYANWLDYAAKLDALLEGHKVSAADPEHNISIRPRGVVELLAVFINGLLRRSLVSNVPHNVRPVLIRALVTLKSQLLQDVPEVKVFARSLSTVLSCLLHETESNIRTILLEHEICRCCNYAERITMSRKSNGESVVFDWPDVAAYQRYCAMKPGSRILTTIHMGNFYAAFRHISVETGVRRQIISLRRENPDTLQADRFVSPDSDHTVYEHGQYDTASLIAQLRADEVTLAVLFDLSDDFGGTVEVLFFGFPARFVKGPALLAIVGRVPIIPFFCFECEGRQTIETECVIDSGLLPGENLEQAATRLTQGLVTLAEKWISRYPAQWKYLDSVTHYFTATGTSDPGSAVADRVGA